eukprot:TRINITY_DN3760_c1_g1_i1.p1 TRINITY_DN3760_c1_g1~~TRINITY_DN3760_c1_g1_i1.p1  ORF type:complete len:670 (+),score=150.48 TRINITY_DN3760_c1_g1_i1:43-2052(+)
MRCQNLVEKIVQRHVVDGVGKKLPETEVTKSGKFVSIKPHRVMTHDNTAAVMPKFEGLFAKGDAKFHSSEQPFFGIDHDVQNKTEKNLAKYKSIKDFASKHGITFSGAGEGIAHQIMVENGYAFPGTMVVASDSHSNMYGGVGCLGTPVVRTDAAAIWATGQTWWTVPPVTKVNLIGSLQEGCTGKDVIITLCSEIGNDEVLNHAVEFSGPGVKTLSVDERLTVANMTTEWGALVGLFPVDDVLIDWMRNRQSWASSSKFTFPNASLNFSDETISQLEADLKAGLLSPDEGASYSREHTLDLSKVTPSVSGPNSVKISTPAKKLFDEGPIKINKAYIVSCTNSRASDLAAAAKVFTSSGVKKLAPGVELYIAPASASVQQEAEAAGSWQTLLDVGAIPLPAGCGPCVGLGVGLLEDGEVGISATNRNFKGRMGHPNAKCYLASPAVVAASAAAGVITSQSPAALTDSQSSAVVIGSPLPETPKEPVSLLPGFQETLSGALVYCKEDNLNTDGIYAGAHTYSDLAPEQMAKVCMENYDPQFQEMVTAGDIIVGGYNFGCGSSREQAATCLKFRGIPLVIAGSFSETYKRNAFNNGFAALESPSLVDYLRSLFPDAPLTLKSDKQLELNFRKSEASFDGKTFPVAPLGPFAQEICLAGGLEGWVKQRLSAA